MDLELLSHLVMKPRLFCFVLLLTSPVYSAVCNLENCRNISSNLSESFFELNDSQEFDLSADVVMLTGIATDNCHFSVECVSDFTKANFTMDFSENDVNISVTYNPNYKRRKDEEMIKPALYDITRKFKIAFQLKLDQTVGEVFGNYYDDNFLNYQLNYLDDFDKEDVKDLKLLLKGEQVDTRRISAEGCNEDFNVLFCACKEPVIANLDWNEENSTLSCNAVSIKGHEELNITWQDDNGTTIPEYQNETTGDLMKTSILSNITSMENEKNYTCIVSLKSDRETNVSRSKRIPAFVEETEEPTDGKEEEVKDENSSLLTIIITVVAVGLVVIVLACVGIVKLVEQFTKKEDPAPLDEDAVEPTAGNSSDEQIFSPSNPDRESDIQSTYQDLEELLDAVEPKVAPQSNEVPLYAAVTVKKPAEQENIYNRLDPKLMTVNRGDPDRWRTFRPGGPGTLPTTMGPPPTIKPPPTMGPSSTVGPPPSRLNLQPSASNGSPDHHYASPMASNFSPDPEEGLYEMQTLKL